MHREPEEIAAALERVVEQVGRDRFEAACGWAWRTAEGTGRHTREQAEAARWPDDLADVPHEITDVLWPGLDDPVEGADDLTRQRVVLAAYRRMPCYALLMLLPNVRTPELLDDYGAHLRDLLEAEDPRLADPVAYHLWSGDFEAGPGRAAQAWAAVTTGASARVASGASSSEAVARRLARVLEASGPVPWAVKRDLLATLVGSARWRSAVFDALDRAGSELHGALDEDEARRWGWRGGRG